MQRGTRRIRWTGAPAAVLALLALVGAVTTGVAVAEPDPQAEARAQTATGPLVAGTPCTSSARACVQLSTRQTWLIENGRIAFGPVPMRPGDARDPTPRGTFGVQWKAEKWTSREHLTQMPYSVFFAEGGVAFHQGAMDTPSAGCVKLDEANARHYFDTLQVGDQVQVH
ncbi:L,D-transpeptidase [Pseudonocardia kongjuensis]|uniref:L,D-transpeptidase n=1 Tax=Pseudonocardia kongjuensis TaxID=102227 RepID=A0ABP4I3E6_9PSEU